jgi:hypothetical protein
MYLASQIIIITIKTSMDMLLVWWNNKIKNPLTFLTCKITDEIFIGDFKRN